MKNMKLWLLMILLAVPLLMATAEAAPQGLNTTSNTTVSGPTIPDYTRQDAGGTITTLLVNQSQQTEAWKGYVGNVTGKVALRDSSGYTIYDWNFASIAGEIYASRTNSITWTAVNCTNHTTITSEYSAVNMADSDVDSINKTFNATKHASITVGSLTVENDTCASTATYNGTAQNVNSTARFQEVLLKDTGSNMIYTTILEQDKIGYNTFTYDFQLIVPDSDAAATDTTYYFFAELT
ncbi:hypothetical protein C4573_04960 [Candidatus Woesearchaeota archaeon]|nr:MAG: hypothetical protein C4573_04960 [Candidatus Woesearchaeota archaeon]